MECEGAGNLSARWSFRLCAHGTGPEKWVGKSTQGLDSAGLTSLALRVLWLAGGDGGREGSMNSDGGCCDWQSQSDCHCQQVNPGRVCGLALSSMTMSTTARLPAHKMMPLRAFAYTRIFRWLETASCRLRINGNKRGQDEQWNCARAKLRQKTKAAGFS